MTSTCPPSPDRYQAAGRIPVRESEEPLLDLEEAGLLAVPVYHLNGWSASERLYARARVVEKLRAIEDAVLRPLGVRWVVWDAWRSRETQCAIYQHYWRAMSLAHPQCSSQTLRERVQDFVTLPVRADYAPPHTTGGAVDLGLWDEARQRCVALGADFDEFTPLAALRAFDAPHADASVRRWRQMMFEALDAAGFSHDENEYFHKDFGNQRWAALRGHEQAPYGEVTGVERSSAMPSRPQARFAALQDKAQHQTWVKQLADALDLAHPAAHAAPVLEPPELLARRWLAHRAG